MLSEKAMSAIFFLYSEAFSRFSISCFRRSLKDKKSASSSMPRNLLPAKFAAMPVVLLPVKGSSIHAFLRVDASIALYNTDKDIFVIYLPNNCSIHVILSNEVVKLVELH